MRGAIFALGAASVAVLLGCSSGSASSADPCPHGICIGPPPGGTDGGGGPTVGPDGGPPPPPGACVPAWSCAPWKTTDGKNYTRTCTDANNCGAAPPVESAQLPSLDMDYYKCNVEPIFDRGCAMMGCHGTETGRLFKVYARGRLRHSEQVPNVCPGPNPVDLATGNGTVMCLGWTSHTRAEWQSNYDSARSFAVGITTANADTSELLAQPLNQAAGGKAHAGVHLFKDKTDQDYQTIKAWITGAALGTTCDSKGN